MIWYAVHCKHPRIAEINLMAQGFQTYFPRKFRDNTREIEFLFDNYGFLYHEGQDLSPIRSTVGCVGLVRFGRENPPAPVSSAIIEGLRALETADGVLPGREYQPGDRVRLKTPAFEFCEAVVREADPRRRLLYLKSFLAGGDVAVRYDEVQPA